MQKRNVKINVELITAIVIVVVIVIPALNGGENLFVK
jgi:hypothetical protein